MARIVQYRNTRFDVRSNLRRLVKSAWSNLSLVKSESSGRLGIRVFLPSQELGPGQVGDARARARERRVPLDMP